MNTEEEVVLKQGQTLEDEANSILNKKDGDEKSDGKLNRQEMIKYVAIGAAVLVIAFIGLAVYSKFRSPNTSEEETYTEEETVTDETDLFAEVEMMIFDDAQREALRAVGYTGDEIEAFAAEGADVDTLVTEAKERIQQTYADEWDIYMDSASAEFKALYNKTWLGGKRINNLTYNEEGYEDNYILTLNLDYEKVEARGNQLFIRLEYEDGYIFMDARPDRWVELPDKGNMVVDVEFMVYNGNTIVIDCTEVMIDGN